MKNNPISEYDVTMAMARIRLSGRLFLWGGIICALFTVFGYIIKDLRQSMVTAGMIISGVYILIGILTLTGTRIGYFLLKIFAYLMMVGWPSCYFGRYIIRSLEAMESANQNKPIGKIA